MAITAEHPVGQLLRMLGIYVPEAQPPQQPPTLEELSSPLNVRSLPSQPPVAGGSATYPTGPGLASIPRGPEVPPLVSQFSQEQTAPLTPLAAATPAAPLPVPDVFATDLEKDPSLDIIETPKQPLTAYAPPDPMAKMAELAKTLTTEAPTTAGPGFWNKMVGWKQGAHPLDNITSILGQATGQAPAQPNLLNTVLGLVSRAGSVPSTQADVQNRFLQNQSLQAQAREGAANRRAANMRTGAGLYETMAEMPTKQRYYESMINYHNRQGDVGKLQAERELVQARTEKIRQDYELAKQKAESARQYLTPQQQMAEKMMDAKVRLAQATFEPQDQEAARQAIEQFAASIGGGTLAPGQTTNLGDVRITRTR